MFATKPFRQFGLLTMSLPLVVSALLAGCANPSKVANQSAVMVTPAGQPSVAADITARYESQLCDEGFAYITFAISNTSNEWLELKKPSLVFPYADEINDFEVVTGGRLAAWARAETAELEAASFNQSVLSGLAMGVGVIMMNKTNDNTRKAGASLVGASLLGRGIEAFNSQYRNASSPVSMKDNQHILSGNILVPPQKSLQYWVVLHATKNAPLMGYVSLGFDAGDNQRHYAVTPLTNWPQCHWQEARKEFLEEWAREEQRKDKSISANDSSAVLEVEYQKRKQG